MISLLNNYKFRECFLRLFKRWLSRVITWPLPVGQYPFSRSVVLLRVWCRCVCSAWHSRPSSARLSFQDRISWFGTLCGVCCLPYHSMCLPQEKLFQLAYPGGRWNGSHSCASEWRSPNIVVLGFTIVVFFCMRPACLLIIRIYCPQVSDTAFIFTSWLSRIIHT